MKPIPHGTADGYFNHRCRCDLCRAAGSTYMRLLTERPCPTCGKPIRSRYRPGSLCRSCRAIAQTIPLKERHGTEVGYTAKGCRCDACRKAANAARRQRRQANPEAREKENRMRMERYYASKSEEAPA